MRARESKTGASTHSIRQNTRLSLSLALCLSGSLSGSLSLWLSLAHSSSLCSLSLDGSLSGSLSKSDTHRPPALSLSLSGSHTDPRIHSRRCPRKYWTSPLLRPGVEGWPLARRWALGTSETRVGLEWDSSWTRVALEWD